MKKNLRYFMTLLLMMVASVGWGQNTVTKTIESIAQTNNWENSKQYLSFSLDDKITVSATGGGNSGKYYVSGTDWRLYQNESPTMTISAAEGYTISSVIITYSVSNNGVLKDASGNVPSGTEKSVYASSITFNVGNTGTATNGQVRVTKISVTYSESGSTPTLEISDLALNTTTLELDLYDNPSSKTVSFTTSSTGTITVSESEYVTTSISDKTITVTPLKVTPSPQTITVSQEADDTYQAGTATFTVSIDDSTPSSDVWVETSLAALSASDVFVIVGNNGDNYAMSNGNGTDSAPSAVAVTVEEGKITSNVSDYIKWTVSGNATDGYTFYPNGSTEKWLYCTNSNNGVRVGTNENKTFTIEGGYLKHGGTSRYVGIYNSSDWRCYTSSGGNIANQTFKFYKRADGATTQISASDVDLDYNATPGVIDYTIINPNGGVLTASASAEWITDVTVDAANSKVTFNCTANEETEQRTATVTLTYGDITKTVTITQAAAPVVYTTIPDIFEAAKSTEQDVKVTFNNWVVSGISTNGKNVFVTDKEGHGFVIYSSEDQSSSYKVGDVLSGTSVPCKLKLFNGFAEIIELDANNLTITDGGSVTASNIALAELTGVNTGALVSYKNLTCSIDENNYYYLSDGTTTIQVYNSLYNFGTLEADKKYNITGIYQQYGNKKEVLPRSSNDIVEVITITPAKEYTTLTSAYALDFTNTGLSAYIVKEEDVTATSVKLTQVSKVRAGTGLVLKGTADTEYSVPVLTGEPEDVSENKMKGSATETIAIAENAGYILKDGKFSPSAAGTLAAGKAYLAVAVVPTSGAKDLAIVFGEGTGINNVNVNENESGKIFNLAGQQMKSAVKGVYIKNGKKYIK